MRDAWLVRLLASVTLFALFAVSAARADEAFFDLAIDHLSITEGKLPRERANDDWRNFQFREMLRAYVVLDGPGEAYAINGFQNRFAGAAPLNHLVIRLPEPRDVTGRLYLENDDATGMVEVKFKVPVSEAKPQSRESFYHTMEDHYENLLAQGCPGAAWFRQRAREAHKVLDGKEDDSAQGFPSRPATLDDTYSLFSGNQALAENLQLGKALPPGAASKGEKEVDVDSLSGIAVAAIDWRPYNSDKKPATDPLAAAIPADQHAIFCHNLESLIALAGEAERNGTPVLQFTEMRSDDAGSRQRYERQLGLSLSGLARLIGPHFVKSIAVTGSDPYLRGGSDLAILFEPKEGDGLKFLLKGQISAIGQATSGAKEVDGKVGSLQFMSVRSPDRALSSYLAALNDGTVVVTNSEAQLARLAAVQDGKAAPLSKAPEYLFFRGRYKLGEGDESALLILSDATIRRWCSARWRIADSRRTRAAAVMADLNVRNLDALVAGKIEPRPLYGEFPVPGLDELRLTPHGVVSSTYGSLDFLTPISEMKLDKVTEGEAQAYGRWRDTYETNWRGVFDPIAVRFFVSPKKLAADVTVMPLIYGSQYRTIVDITSGAKIAPSAGDPHDCMIRAGMALNMNSGTMKSASAYAMSIAPNIKIDPLGWVGQSAWFYLDEDPIWAELAAAPRPDEFFQKNMGRMPIGIYVEVSNGFKLTAFLIAAHAFVDQSAPGMTVWENLTYKDQSYVKITPSEQAKGQNKELKDIALYYHATGDALLITLSEPMLKRAIDRQLDGEEAKKSGKPLVPAGQPSLGSSIVMQVNARGFDFIRVLASYANSNEFEVFMQRVSWSNLPILNEWKHRYPEQDPLKIYERFFHARLVDPAGGQYVWNEQWQTMESTVYGSPAQPRKGPTEIAALKGLLRANLGVTFEDEGLRAKVDVDREEK